MSVGDENVAIRSGDDSRGPIEGVRAVSCNTRFSEGQQDLSIRAKFDNLVALAVFSSASVTHTLPSLSTCMP